MRRMERDYERRHGNQGQPRGELRRVLGQGSVRNVRQIPSIGPGSSPIPSDQIRTRNPRSRSTRISGSQAFRRIVLPASRTRRTPHRALRIASKYETVPGLGRKSGSARIRKGTLRTGFGSIGSAFASGHGIDAVLPKRRNSIRRQRAHHL